MNKKTNSLYSVFLTLIFVFTILKLNRNVSADTVQQGGIWNILTIFFFLAALYYMFTKVIHKKTALPLSIKISVLYSAICIVNACINIESLDLRNVYFLLMIPYFSSILLIFCLISQKEISRKEINLTVFFFFVIIVFVINTLIKIKTIEGTPVAVANVYYGLTFFPLLLFFNNRNFYYYSSFILVIISILLSAKRTSLIGFVLFTVIVLFMPSDNKNKVKNLSFILVFLLIFAIIFNFMNLKLKETYNADIMHRMETLHSDGGSGRDISYKLVWNGIRTSNIEHIIAGHGMFSAGKICFHGKAHNDFLEIMYDYGLLPLVLLVAFYIALFYETYLMYKQKYRKAHIFFGGVVISFLLSCFSNYCDDFSYVTCGMTFIGVALGQWQYYTKSNKE